MPFDGISTTRGAKAVYVIDKMIEAFDDGKGWICGTWRSTDKKQRCLMGALNFIRATDPVAKNLRITPYFIKAIGAQTLSRIKERHGYPTLNAKNAVIAFNDANNTYKPIHEMLLKARKLAEQDI